jgi:biopolymer transport protein ExbD
MAAITGNKKSATFIDMTPMVDLAFLLLTFFVLTTSLFKPHVMPIAMPEKEGQQPLIDQDRVLNLVLGDHDKIYWYVGIPQGKAEYTNFSSMGIRKILLEKQVQIKNMYVLIKPSDQSQYKNVVDILDEMMITNIHRYAMVDMETEDRNLLKELNK